MKNPYILCSPTLYKFLSNKLSLGAYDGPCNDGPQVNRVAKHIQRKIEKTSWAKSNELS